MLSFDLQNADHCLFDRPTLLQTKYRNPGKYCLIAAAHNNTRISSCGADPLESEGRITWAGKAA
jgi:hypothetical protein